MNSLEIGIKVHYVWSDGKCYDAEITRIWHKENKVVDLIVHLSDEVPEHVVSTILYFENHVPNTWHWSEEEENV